MLKLYEVSTPTENLTHSYQSCHIAAIAPCIECFSPKFHTIILLLAMHIGGSTWSLDIAPHQQQKNLI